MLVDIIDIHRLPTPQIISVRNGLRLFPKDSILIPKSGASVNLNHRAKLGIEAYVSSPIAVVIPDRTIVDPDYLYWWSTKYDPRMQAQGAILPSLKLSTLKSAVLNLPPLDDQRRIADILGQVESLRLQALHILRQASTLVDSLMFRFLDDMTE